MCSYSSLFRKMWLNISRLFILCYIGLNIVDAEYKRICYWSSWAVYRMEEGTHQVKDIDPNRCTHLIYAFATITLDYKLASFDPNCDLEDNNGLGNYKKFTDLKKENPRLKTLLAVGGWTLGSKIFSNMVRTKARRKKFIRSSIKLLRKYKFDGLDFDWEFPTLRGGIKMDKPNFSIFCQEIREIFKRESKKSKKDELLFTIALSQNYKILTEAYDFEKISQFTDFFSIMAYDFHGDWDKIIDHNSPLYSRSTHSEEHQKFTVNFVTQFCLNLSIPPEKLILGVPFYGHTYILAHPNQNIPGDKSISAGPAGKHTKQDGVLAYFEICKLFKDDGWTHVWQNEYKAPYAYKDTLWISYDNATSIKIKADYIKKMKIGGAMVWSLEQDDFNNICGQGKSILLDTLTNTLSSEITDTNDTLNIADRDEPNLINVSNINTNSSTMEIFNPVFTQSSINYDIPLTDLYSTDIPDHDSNKDHSNSYTCVKEGMFRNDKKCSNFVFCIKKAEFCNIKSCYYKIEMSCPDGLVFDEENKVCNWPEVSEPCDYTAENIKYILTTENPNIEVVNACFMPGIFKNQLNCKKFYECVDKGNCYSGSCYIKYDKECPAGLVFDETSKVCNWPISDKSC